MCIGWALGRRLVAWGDRAAEIAPRVLATWGAASLVLFLVVRGVDGYGNMLLHRDGVDPLQWLHVSKYPPSISYVALELGIASILLAALFRYARGDVGPLGRPVLLFGQVALFYYLLHIHLLHLVGWALGLRHSLGLESAWLGALGALLVLYPACRWYRGYKAAHPNGLARFI
jgi:hypothetical protein